MKKINQSLGFSVIGLLVIIVILLAVGLIGGYVWHKHTVSKPVMATGVTTQTSDKKSVPQTDPSEGGKYLLIKEWGVRVLLPEDLQGKATYEITEAVDPDTSLTLQAAKIYVTTDSLTGNDCAVTSTALSSAVDSGAQYIRSDNSKPFNATRYKWIFKEDILTQGNYSFHLNYVTPDCVGGGSNTTKIEELQTALIQLTKVD